MLSYINPGKEGYVDEHHRRRRCATPLALACLYFGLEAAHYHLTTRKCRNRFASLFYGQKCGVAAMMSVTFCDHCLMPAHRYKVILHLLRLCCLLV